MRVVMHVVMRALPPEFEFSGRGRADLARDPSPRPGRGAPGQELTDARLSLVADDLRQRLRSVCGEWSEAEFENVVQLIARTKVRWADGGSGH